MVGCGAGEVCLCNVAGCYYVHSASNYMHCAYIVWCGNNHVQFI